ncbi:MAG: peroxiredoxin family protein [Planctomycetota bacterium]|nr:peroxiredoxin family protein [Planctomycetota bacterium]
MKHSPRIFPAWGIGRISSHGAVCVVALWLAGVALADDKPAATPPAAPAPATLHGHSYMGETFDEGPRQKAYLMGTTGRVNFPATTTVPDAQSFVNQGVGQLHGFWYLESERSFRQAAALDPKCAIAFWGMAMANTNNEKRAKGFLEQAIKLKPGISEREVMYIDALDAYYKADRGKDKERHETYAKALEKIIYKFPNDIEAKALLGLQLWLNRGHGSNLVSHLAVDALLKEVIAVEPLHPCHHYRIHLWDYEKSDLALDSSALCGQGSPGIAHMWHMPGHIYSRVQRYDDAVWQQEASARCDHAYMIRDRVLPDEIHNYAHNNEWLVRNLGYLGRARDGISLAKNLGELPRHPRHNVLGGGKSAFFSRQRLFETLALFELWDELITLADTPYLEPTDDEGEQIKRLRHLGSAFVRKGEGDRAVPVLKDLEDRIANLRPKLAEFELPKPVEVKLPDGAEPRPEMPALPQLSDDENNRKRQLEGRIRPIELAIAEIHGHQAATRGDFKVAHEELQNAGGVDAVYLAKLQLLLGERDKALQAGRAAVDSRKNRFSCRATHCFAQVRLTPMVQTLGMPSDWRTPKPASNDVGVRPELDSIGPYRYHPYVAPEWALKDATGGDRSSALLRGKPTVVIFYLGYECLHCAQQLQAFAPLTAEFEKAGISLIAISTDDATGLKKSLDNYKQGNFPFPLTSDSTLTTFKAFRAFDDFENKPLHGTFFVDAAGLVRWQDIGHEPFQDARFVLNEAKRLMALPTQTVPPAANAVAGGGGE